MSVLGNFSTCDCAEQTEQTRWPARSPMAWRTPVLHAGQITSSSIMKRNDNPRQCTTHTPTRRCVNVITRGAYTFVQMWRSIGSSTSLSSHFSARKLNCHRLGQLLACDRTRYHSEVLHGSRSAEVRVQAGSDVDLMMYPDSSCGQREHTHAAPQKSMSSLDVPERLMHCQWLNMNAISSETRSIAIC